MKRKNNSTAAWIFTLIAVAGILCGLSESFRNYFEEPHLSADQLAELHIQLLPEARDLPDLSTLSKVKKHQWYGLLVQPKLCDAICQGEMSTFESNGQAVLRPGDTSYAQTLSLLNKVGDKASPGLLLLVNRHNQLAGSITPPYSVNKINQTFTALNQ
ncbi:hypothetical protein [Marinomonas pollencensis]|uniref:Cytochrome oxidase Cu insertion factor (SCO1/SenC/PrrC family) n=1 Tax=Marinomonas pollencensis TaxID=491954 RepID=A0A3E0DPG3_9GAMM|nr:hypothetical protein [Marinomonas pollencensis]REG83735.1 hypothetical protein DFP81_105101 [Marinomonas pollencensis]